MDLIDTLVWMKKASTKEILKFYKKLKQAEKTNRIRYKATPYVGIELRRRKAL